MGKVMSIMWKPFRDFNLESRAHRIISQDKPKPAPKYKSDELAYGRLLKEHPEALQQALKKSDQLDKHLKNVYVTSTDPLPHAPQSSSSAERRLPLDRSPVKPSEFGYPEPKKVPYGRVTLRSALKFISKHQQSPTENSIEQIAEEHKLTTEVVDNIIKYFKVYEIYVPNERKVKAKFVGPVVPRKQVITHKPKQLPPGKGNT